VLLVDGGLLSCLVGSSSLFFVEWRRWCTDVILVGPPDVCSERPHPKSDHRGSGHDARNAACSRDIDEGGLENLECVEKRRGANADCDANRKTRQVSHFFTGQAAQHAGEPDHSADEAQHNQNFVKLRIVEVAQGSFEQVLPSSRLEARGQ